MAIQTDEQRKAMFAKMNTRHSDHLPTILNKDQKWKIGSRVFYSPGTYSEKHEGFKDYDEVVIDDYYKGKIKIRSLKTGHHIWVDSSDLGNYRPATKIIGSGVYYDGMLKETFKSHADAEKYIKRELHDPNADKKKFEIKPIDYEVL